MSALAHPGRVPVFDSVASATRAARPPSLNPAPSPLLARGIPGIAPPRDHYAGAYSDPPADTSQGNLADANTRALQSIARSLNEREDSTTQERGKVGSIGKVEERCVHYARACDNFHVTLCSGVFGRTAFNALRNIASQGRSLMKTTQLPVNTSNRIAYGMSALAIGGRCHLSAAEWSLGTGDFPQTSEEQFDSFRPSNGNLLEKKPRHATTLLAWHRDALHMSWALACFFKEERYAHWEEAADYLRKLSEQHEYAWPADAIFGVWAELWNRWCEELREIDRRVLRELREEAPSYDRIRFFLTAPGSDGTPWLRLPSTFDLEDPDEYFQRDVMGRQTRALNRACWGGTLRKSPASSEPRKAGADPAPTADGPAAGRQRNGGRDTKVVGSTTPVPESAPPNRPFIGPTLTQEERARAMAHAPKTHDGSRVLRWDAGTHRGCPNQECRNAHGALGKLHLLDPAVQMEIARRGGLKEEKKLEALQAAQRIDTLRKGILKKAASDRNPPRKAGGDPPGPASQTDRYGTHLHPKGCSNPGD